MIYTKLTAQDYKEIKGFLKDTDILKTYDINDSDGRSNLDREFEQIEILDSRFTLEYDIFIKFGVDRRTDSYYVYSKEMYVQNVFIDEDVMEDLTKEQKDELGDLLLNKFDFNC